MNARTFAILSVLLNLLLLAGIWRASHAPAPAGLAGATPESSPALVRVRTNLSRVEVTLTNTPPPFRWEEVHSEDLTNYVANLRALGCPRETVRDIISGELEARYLARRREFLEPWQRRYWDYAVQGIDKIEQEISKPLEEIKEGTLELLDALTGPAPSEREAGEAKRPVGDMRTEFLSEDKQRQLAALDKQFNELGQALPRERGPITPERRAKLKEIEARRLAAVQAVLTPEEFEEYRLRTSKYAHIGRGLDGFEASADELRAVTRVHDRFRAADESIDRKAPDYEARRQQQQEWRRQRDEALKAELGDERYANLKRAQDVGFRELHRVADRYGLPREAVIQADDLRRIAQDNIKRVRGNASLEAGQQQELIRAIQDETRAAMIQALGERAARTYERHGGDWLRKGP